jgi:hypothetical protein
LFQLLIYGAIFSCLEPLLTVAAVFSLPSFFTVPQIPKDLERKDKDYKTKKERRSEHIEMIEERRNYVFFSFFFL